jgi:hypothetical protein
MADQEEPWCVCVYCQITYGVDADTDGGDCPDCGEWHGVTGGQDD